MKKLINIVLLLALVLSSPILVDRANTLYIVNVLAPKAMPVKFENRIIASSFQIKYKGKRLTVTNNHVCSVIKNVAERRASDRSKIVIKTIKSNNLPTWIEKILLAVVQKVKDSTSFPIVGESLKIGHLNRKVLYNSPNHDICFLEPVGSSSFSLASSVSIGERITIIGHPRGKKQSITEGRIVGEGFGQFNWLPKAGVIRILRSTAITYPGNSGSPVLNRFGNVIGILFSGYSLNYLNVNGVVPLKALESELEAYIEQK